MKFLNRLTKRFQTLFVGLVAVIPLLTVTPSTFAADEPSVEFSQAELDQMLAPIALYPDALLSQVLIASTYPLEIIQADRWVRSNKDLKAEDALKFAENKDWDPSVKALVAFPDVLRRMSDDVDWTQRLGDAFLSDEDEVMDAVQRLRKRAYATGNLEKAQHISVEREDDNILIEPAQERVVYVPVYDTRVVYGNWWWPQYPPVYWHYPSSYTYVSGFYWGPSIYIGPTYFYSSCHWRDRRVVVIDRHTHYSGSPRFYTGRSIVRHENSRAWRHNPSHRHGVAYYNNNLRETYGSRRDSYQNDRQYREQHRDMSRLNEARANNVKRDAGMGRTFNNNTGGNGTGHRDERLNNDPNRTRSYDRAEQVRARLDQQPNTNARPWHTNSDNSSGDRRDNMTSNNRVRNTTEDIRNDANSNVRTRDIERGRTAIQHRQVDANNAGTNSAGANPIERVNQERRVTTEQVGRHPRFSTPSPQVVEQRANNPAPQPNMERREEPPRRVETAPPQRIEHRNEQRAERANPRAGLERRNDGERAR